MRIKIYHIFGPENDNGTTPLFSARGKPPRSGPNPENSRSSRKPGQAGEEGWAGGAIGRRPGVTVTGDYEVACVSACSHEPWLWPWLERFACVRDTCGDLLVGTRGDRRDRGEETAEKRASRPQCPVRLDPSGYSVRGSARPRPHPRNSGILGYRPVQDRKHGSGSSKSTADGTRQLKFDERQELGPVL